MSDSSPAVALRVVRPYATEEGLLENELETLTRTSITLLGAQSRPQGLMLRFELALSSGPVLMRGEGRVLGYKEDAHQGMSGLTVRFTRLDSRSKALVDKAAALRERRRPVAAIGAAEAPSLAAPPMRVEDFAHEDATAADSEGRRSEDPAPSHPSSDSRRSPSHDRNALLQRLRARSKGLDGDAVRRILERSE